MVGRIANNFDFPTNTFDETVRDQLRQKGMDVSSLNEACLFDSLIRPSPMVELAIQKLTEQLAWAAFHWPGNQDGRGRRAGSDSLIEGRMP